MRRPLPPALVVLGALLAANTSASGDAEATVTERIAEADSRLADGEVTKALRAYRRADELARGASFSAILGIARCHHRLEEFDEALEAIRRALRAMRPAPEEAQLEQLRGVVLISRHLAGIAVKLRMPDPLAGFRPAEEQRQLPEERIPFRVADAPDLVAAEEAFRRVLGISAGGWNAARYHLAEALHLLRRDGEARVVLDSYFARGAVPELAAEAATLSCWLNHHPVEPTDVDVLPERIGGRAPQYTTAAQRGGLRGMAILESVVDTAGTLRCLRPLRGLALGLTEEAVAALSTWKFQPAVLDGQPVPVAWDITVAFTLMQQVPGRR